MTYDGSTFPVLPQSWATISVAEAHDLVAVRDKVQVKNYSDAGVLAVVDQGVGKIGGYTDDRSLAMQADLPVIVFGDHTRALKYVDFPFAAGADGIKVMRPRQFFLPRLFFRFLQAVRLPARGYARHFQYLQASRLAVPPLNEQKRIVDKLDAVLAGVDACRERLDRVPDMLERFRQCAFASATSSDIAKEWREAPLEELVDILDSRRIPLNARERERRNAGKRAEELFPYYGATGLAGHVAGFLFDEPLILLGEDGVPFLDPMRPKAYQVSGKCWVNNHAHVLRARADVADARYVTAVLNAFDYSGRVTGTTRLKLTQGAMRAIPMLVPPLVEQERIADDLEKISELTETLEAHWTAARDRVERLTPALLAKAFRGELVPQDARDEPASVLLERIRATRATEMPGGSPRSAGGGEVGASRAIAAQHS